MPLDAAQTSRLVKLLGMTSSDYAGEALAAIRKANDLISRAGMTWADIITAEPEPRRAVVQWQEPRDTLEAVRLCLALIDAPLSAWDVRFLVSIARREDDLTEKQQIQLNRIVETCRHHTRQAA